MTPAPSVHSYQIIESQNCVAVIAIYRRQDGQRIAQVAIVSVTDKDLPPDRLGEQLCVSFDQELQTRCSGKPH